MSKTLELLKEHPETTKLIQAWYLDKMLESFNDDSVPDDFKEMMRATPIDDDKISKMIDGAPRLLFDFFDENEIIIETVHNGGKWWYSIDGASTPNFFSSRKEAEKYSIEEVFQVLNDKIVNSDL